MARNLAVGQFVYKFPTENNISPAGYSPEKDICSYLDGPIISLGVQAPQGTKMYINNQPAVIGPTGVFELNNVIEINSFKLEENANLRKIVIDVLYVEGSEQL